MGNSFILILAGLFNFAIALSFASLYFKGQSLEKISKPLAGYLFFNVLLALIGTSAGKLFTASPGHLVVKAGAALILIVAIKLFVRAINAKTINRIFDIGQLPTLIGLLLVLNIDVMLASTGIALISKFNMLTILTLFGSSSLAGLMTGFMAGNKMPFIMSNILDLMAAIAMAILGFAFLLR